MNIHAVLELLKAEHHITTQSSYYQYIALWRDWWRGCCPSFHLYREKGSDGALIPRKLYSLRMAKKVCEDWAALLLNEKTALTLGCQGAAQFLQGPGGCGGLLSRLDFWQRANALVEHAFCCGTGAFLLHLHNLRHTKSGEILPDSGAALSLEYLPAGNIIPLTTSCGAVTEAAFCSEALCGGRRFLYLETHLLQKGCYVIENRYFSEQNGRLIPKALPAGLLPRMETGSPLPLFSLVRPNLQNPIDQTCGLGVSVFADALDCLEGVDLAFNNLCRDFKLGGKKVFVSRSLVTSDEAGHLLTPDDVCRQLFLTVGERMPGEAPLIYEHNPALRVAENTAGLQAQLDYLSFRCGLGARHYRLESGAVLTATEYVGSRQTLIQNAAKHTLTLETALAGILKAMLWAGKRVLGQKLDPGCAIGIRFDDSVIHDRESERERDRRDVSDGLMRRFEYRMKWYGEDKEAALRMTGENLSDQKGGDS